MAENMLIAGGGIGGLAAAWACSRAGWHVRLWERAPEFGEPGAGIQLGPNVTRVLQVWGLAAALEEVAAFPDRLQVRSAVSGRELGVLRLGATTRQRYGAPYATLHRADLQRLLLNAVQEQSEVRLECDRTLSGFAETPQGVSVRSGDGSGFEADVLLGADGLWSTVRQRLLGDGPPRVTGHMAYRALLPQAGLPERLRSQHITVWLGPDLHVVQYPVKRGEWLNLVGIVHARALGRKLPQSALSQAAGQAAASERPDPAPDLASWDQHSGATQLRTALAGSCAPLQDLAAAADGWRRWVLCDRAPLRGADQMARGCVALLGDAAHPMRPYLAQGAGMAIEDAAALGTVLADGKVDPAAALGLYAQRRWQRNARVQARSARNGQIFHARGPVRWGRDLALAWLGEGLLDLSWLYRR